MFENEEGIAVTKICLYIFSNAYIADQYRLSRVPLKNRMQSHFCRTLLGVEESSVNFSLSALFVLVSVDGVFLVFKDFTTAA